MVRLLIALVTASAFAQLPPADYAERVKRFEESLQWQQGTVMLKNGLAKVEIPPEFRYLNHANAVKVLELWGNKGVGNTLGMIFPSSISPASREAWGVVITYEDDGHIKDDDAKSIDYTKLLAEMQDRIKEENEARKEQKLREIELLGWATSPQYDSATHKMFWAKELRFANDPANTLNYNIRVLGKEGVLNLNAVASMDQLKMIEEEAPRILAFTDFTQGNRYEDYQPGVHKLAGYGLAGLVAGGAIAGVAAKLGVFKFLIPVFLALKKFIVLIVVGAMGTVRAFFRRRKAGVVTASAQPPAPEPKA